MTVAADVGAVVGSTAVAATDVVWGGTQSGFGVGGGFSRVQAAMATELITTSASIAATKIRGLSPMAGLLALLPSVARFLLYHS
jgi:hypothetical protein